MGIFWSYGRNGPSKLLFVLRRQDSCLVIRDTSRISSRFGRPIAMLLEGRQETQDHFPVASGILSFLSICKRSQAWSPFEALTSACLSRCQRDVRPPVELKPSSGAYSNISTGYSDIPSSCEMTDEPTFKPLQRNQAFFRVWASLCPFYLRQQTQGPSHIPISERSLLLRCLWKVDIPLESKRGNQLSSRDALGCMELSSSSCTNLGVPLDLRLCS